MWNNKEKPNKHRVEVLLTCKIEDIFKINPSFYPLEYHNWFRDVFFSNDYKNYGEIFKGFKNDNITRI